MRMLILHLFLNLRCSFIPTPRLWRRFILTHNIHPLMLLTCITLSILISLPLGVDTLFILRMSNILRIRGIPLSLNLNLSLSFPRRNQTEHNTTQRTYCREKTIGEGNMQY